MKFLSFKDGILKIKIHAVPNGKKSEVIGLYDEAIKIRIHAPPVDGAANTELCHYIAKLLGAKKSAVSVTHGQTSKNKTLSVTGFSLEAAQEIFEKTLAAAK